MATFKVEKHSTEDLLEIRNKIDRELENRKTKERKEVVKKIRDLAASVGMTPEELLSTGRKAPKSNGAAPKYRDPETGKTWVGRGRKPRWMETALASGKKVEDFAI